MRTRWMRLDGTLIGEGPITHFRADLTRADLACAKLKGSDLSCADLTRADLSCADLAGAKLTLAKLKGADLTRAKLTRADLSCADLTRADLSCADLTLAKLAFAKLKGADLSCADLTRADLSCADLTLAKLTLAKLAFANLSRARLTRAKLPPAPIISDIHRAVYAAASGPGALAMESWHTCETTHCRAGWVVTLAGPEGRALEERIDTSAAAALIYYASDPALDRVPDWYATNAVALADMRRLAEAA